MSKVYEQRKINRKRGGDVGIFLILLIFGAFMALPFIYAILQSFKPLDEIFIFPPKFFVVNDGKLYATDTAGKQLLGPVLALSVQQRDGFHRGDGRSCPLGLHGGVPVG